MVTQLHKPTRLLCCTVLEGRESLKKFKLTFCFLQKLAKFILQNFQKKTYTIRVTKFETIGEFFFKGRTPKDLLYK